jgi:hypothetical protein
MISESWFAIDSDDSPLRNREITTVMLVAKVSFIPGDLADEYWRVPLRSAIATQGAETCCRSGAAHLIRKMV